MVVRLSLIVGLSLALLLGIAVLITGFYGRGIQEGRKESRREAAAVLDRMGLPAEIASKSTDDACKKAGNRLCLSSTRSPQEILPILVRMLDKHGDSLQERCHRTPGPGTKRMKTCTVGARIAGAPVMAIAFPHLLPTSPPRFRGSDIWIDVVD